MYRNTLIALGGGGRDSHFTVIWPFLLLNQPKKKQKKIKDNLLSVSNIFCRKEIYPFVISKFLILLPLVGVLTDL